MTFLGRVRFQTRFPIILNVYRCLGDVWGKAALSNSISSLFVVRLLTLQLGRFPPQWQLMQACSYGSLLVQDVGVDTLSIPCPVSVYHFRG